MGINFTLLTRVVEIKLLMVFEKKVDTFFDDAVLIYMLF